MLSWFRLMRTDRRLVSMFRSMRTDGKGALRKTNQLASSRWFLIPVLASFCAEFATALRAKREAIESYSVEPSRAWNGNPTARDPDYRVR